MFSHNKDHIKDVTLFDVRLKTHGLKNTVLVKGNEAEIENIPLEGHVKLSTKSDLHVKRVRLVLTGEQTVDYYKKSTDGSSGGQVTERNCVLRIVWPNLLCSPKGELHYGDYHDSVIKYSKADQFAKRSQENSVTDLAGMGKDGHTSKSDAPKRPGFHKTKSQPILFKNQESTLVKISKSGIDGTPCLEYAGAKGEGHSFLLPNGNYSMPFSFYLPANTPESVEGLTIGKIRYKLECQIERGRFDRPFKKARHFRIIRTLHSRNMNLYDSIEFNNTWPGKVDFNVSTPRKGMAMGTSIPIKLVIVPLAKGLSFKSMHAEVVQHSNVTGVWGRSPNYEHVMGKSKILCPKPEINEDHWVIEGSYTLPSSLREITQTCTLKNDLISVKHRIRVSIHIRNADGHVSELRANLPVMIYLSPSHGRVVTRHLEIDTTGQFTYNPDPNREDVVFPVREPTHKPLNGAPVNADKNDDDSEDFAPPIYNQHTKDIVFDQTSPRSPIEQLRANSGTSTPIESYFDFPVLRSKATSPLPDLSKLLSIPCYEEAIENESDEDGDEPAPLYSGTSGRNFSHGPPTPTSGISLPRPVLSERSMSMSSLVIKEKQSATKKKHLFTRKEKK